MADPTPIDINDERYDEVVAPDAFTDPRFHAPAPLARGTLTVGELKARLQDIPDDAVVCEDDRDYGVCLKTTETLIGWVLLTAKGESLDWSDTPKDGFARAVLI